MPSANVRDVIKPINAQTLSDTASIELTTLYSCGHSKTEIIKPTDQIINKTSDEIKEIYPNWTIKQFSKNYLVVEEIKETQCENHFVIKLVNNKLQVFQNEKGIIKEVAINVNLLTEEDKKILISGITVNSEYELLEIMESFQ
jgi:ribosomal protein S17E